VEYTVRGPARGKEVDLEQAYGGERNHIEVDKSPPGTARGKGWTKQPIAQVREAYLEFSLEVTVNQMSRIQSRKFSNRCFRGGWKAYRKSLY